MINSYISLIKKFERPAFFDLQVYSDVVNQFDVIIELGVGSGRLCKHWLEMNKKVIGIETESKFINELQNLFFHNIQDGSFCIFSQLEQIEFQNNKSVLIAPYNFIFHLSSLKIFISILQIAFSKGINTIVFDFDNLTKTDIEMIEKYSVHHINDYQEIASLVAKNNLNITWKKKNSKNIIHSFDIFLYDTENVLIEIQSALNECIVKVIKILQDDFFTEINFLKIEKQ